MSKSNKLPALQFYPGDWRKDPGVQSLDYFERGVWLEMLLMMHESEERGVLLLNGKPMSIERLSRLLGLDNQKATTVVNSLLEIGVASRREDGAIFSRRMVRDEELRCIRIEAGKKGGNPKLVNQKATTQDNQKATPSSSSSTSSSTSELDRSIPPSPTPKTRRLTPSVFDPKKSITQDQYQTFLDDRELANGDRAWMWRQAKSMQDKFGERRMKDWPATFRNWMRKARYQFNDPPNQHQKTQINGNGFFAHKREQMNKLKQSIMEDMTNGEHEGSAQESVLRVGS